MVRYPQSDLLRLLFQKGQPISVCKGKQITGNEAEPDGVYFISSGYIKVYSISNNGDEYVHVLYGPGEVFPIIWAYLGIEPDNRFYASISECMLWRMSRDWFNHFITNRLDLSHAFAVQLAQQHRVLADRVNNLEYKKGSERVAYRVLYLASRFGVRQNNCYVIDPAITHEIFASTVNLARETVSRELEKLAQEGVLQLENHRIILCDADRLSQKLSRPVNLNDWYLR